MPMTTNNYDKIVKKLLCATKSLAKVTMQGACEDFHEAEDAETASIINTALSLSCDGFWHRWGHLSLNDLVRVISMKNRKFLDVEAMSRVSKGYTWDEWRTKNKRSWSLWYMEKCS